MTSRAVLERASRVCQLAQIIATEEGLEHNAAYALADATLEEVERTAAAWNEPSPAARPALHIVPTAWGVALRRSGAALVIQPDEVATLACYLAAWQMRNEP